jgi:Flp pilus assembly protein TadG
MKQIGKDFRDRAVRCLRLTKALLADQSGNALVFSALALPVIFGAAALAMDVASWYTTKRQVQTVADASAMAAMHVLAGGGTQAEAETAARTHAQARLGFIDDARRDIQVAYDDGVASGTGIEAIQVTAIQRRQPMLSSLFMAGSVDVRADARAANQVVGESCVLSLEETAGPTVSLVGSANVTASCGFASNSSASNSISMTGASSLDATELQTYGEVSGLSNYAGDPSKVYQHFFRQDDPYADLAVPPFIGCDVPGITKVTGNSTQTISPGTYCGDISVNANGTLYLDPGVYVLYDADFTVNGNGRVEGDGVTIILTGSSASTMGNVSFTGTGVVDLSAPDQNGQTDPDFSGEYAGILFFLDPAAAPGTGAKFAGGSTMVLDGAIYFPTRAVDFKGASSAAPTGCLQIVSQSVSFTGNADLNNTTAACEALGLNEIGARRVRLTL